jgi:hypothetical protein
MRVPGWRALGLTWLAVGLALGGGAAWLHRLGPPGAAPEPPAEAAAQVRPDPPSETAAPGPAAPATEAAAETPAAPAAAPPAVAPALPVAATPGPPPAPPTDPAAPQPAFAAAAPAPPGPAQTAGASPQAAAMAAPAQPPAPAAAAPPARPPAPAAATTPPPAPAPPPLVPVVAAPRAAPRPIAAPDPALQEAGRHGTLPRIGTDGRTSIRAYGAEFDRGDTRPRIGIVVADIGLSASATEDALRRLPAGVALAVSPYAQRPAPAAERARERGLETLIALPLEPAGYPLNDPGDRALLTGRGMAENLDQLDWSLARFQGYVGAIGVVAGMRGERFAALPEAIGAVQEALLRRGLLYIDPRPGAPSPARAWGRAVDVVLDEPARTRHEIDRRLAELEQMARARGTALGLAGAPTPVLVEAIAAWAAGLDQRGLVLAPVSALIRRPESPAGDSPATRAATTP